MGSQASSTPDFDVLFRACEFEYGGLVELTLSYSNLAELRERLRTL